jgi:hypothetical protein
VEDFLAYGQFGSFAAKEAGAAALVPPPAESGLCWLHSSASMRHRRKDAHLGLVWSRHPCLQLKALTQSMDLLTLRLHDSDMNHQS